MTKRRVFLVQVNNAYGGGPDGRVQAFLPYSVGLLRAYAEQFDDVREHYRFDGYLFLREPIDQVIDRLRPDPPDVIGLSVYIWNSNYTMAFAKAAREAFPDCLIVAGGPHVPVKSEAWLREHHAVDVAVHYEGEVTFAEVLRARVSGRPVEEVEGTSCLTERGHYLKAPPRDRVNDLDSIPSPYLEGCFDELMRLDYAFHPVVESDRGCPFSCTFCDWGSNTLAKLKKYSDGRMRQEIDWFGRHKIDLAYGANANFGIFPRDLDLARYMAETKERYGYPNKFRTAYAKNTSDRVFEVARVLHKAGLNKGVTLSFQSLDATTLEAIKRSNIKTDNFGSLMKAYRQEGIATYTELIIGLPGETYDSFADGIDRLIRGGCHDGLAVYSAMILPNAEMGDPEYQERYGIKTVDTAVLFFHGTPSEDEHQERYRIVTETASLPPADWMRCQLYAWAVQCFHNLGLTKAVAVYLHATDGISYRKFYEELLQYAATANHGGKTDSPLGNAWWRALSNFVNLKNGQDWGNVDLRFGGIVWPPEEYGFLTCAADSTNFYVQLKDFLIKHFLMDEDEARELVTYQQCAAVVPTPWTQMRKFTFNVHDVVQAGLLGESVQRRKVDQLLKFTNPRQYESLEDWAKNQVWFGRKGGKFLRDVEVLS